MGPWSLRFAAKPETTNRTSYLFGQSKNVGGIKTPLASLVSLHGSIVPPRIPFWQSKIKQKFVEVSTWLPVKEKQLVLWPPNRNPPPVISPASISFRRKRRCIPKLPWKSGGEWTIREGPFHQEPQLACGEYKSPLAPMQAGRLTAWQIPECGKSARAPRASARLSIISGPECPGKEPNRRPRGQSLPY